MMHDDENTLESAMEKLMHHEENTSESGVEKRMNDAENSSESAVGKLWSPSQAEHRLQDTGLCAGLCSALKKLRS